MSATPSMYEGNDLDSWLIFHGFTMDVLKIRLAELGVETVEDLSIVYTDVDLLEQLKSTLAPVPFRRFLRAPGTTSLLSGLEVVDINLSAAVAFSQLDGLPHMSTDNSWDIVRSMQEEINRICQLGSLSAHKAEGDVRKTLLETRRRSALIADLDAELKNAATLDCAFMVDCTGSMTAYIAKVKEQVTSFVSTVISLYPNLCVRLAFVGYRDHCDGSERIATFKFSTDVALFKIFVAELKAHGGGDEPEDVLGGLETVCGLQWESANRILYHIGDAPCHGLALNGFAIGDSYPAGCPRSLHPVDLLRDLSDMNIQYHFGKITSRTDAMVENFNKLLGSVKKDGDAYVKSSSIDLDTMMTTLSRSATASLTASLSSSRTGEKVHKMLPAIITSTRPTDWNKLPVEIVKVYQVNIPTSMEQIIGSAAHDFQYLAIEPETTVTLTCFSGVEDASNPFEFLEAEPPGVGVRVAPHPFSIGANRAAHYAMLCNDVTSVLTAKRMVVVKQSMAENAAERGVEIHEQALSAHLVATFLAKLFNKQTATLCSAAPKILLCDTALLQFKEREGQPFLIVEEFVGEISDWEKYNNNSGLCVPSPTPELGTDHETVQAFSHWTYSNSGGNLIVVDCQGAYDKTTRTFHLTDPAIHCMSLTRFGGTNLGRTGLKRFFKTHVCGATCRALGIAGSSLIETKV